MIWQIEPMERWPYPETERRSQSQFTASWSDTLSLLGRELRALDLRGAVALRIVGSPGDLLVGIVWIAVSLLLWQAERTRRMAAISAEILKPCSSLRLLNVAGTAPR